MPDPDAKKKFLLTAGFADQEAILAPPPEPIPTPSPPLPSAPRLAPLPTPKAPLRVALGVHRFMSDPISHPSWSAFVERVLAEGLAAWQAQVLFRQALTVLHGRDPATRLSALARLCLELDQQLRPREVLVVGPSNLVAPSASPVASPALPGLRLFSGLDFPEAAPELVASLPAALAATAAWHAPSIRLYAPEGDASPLDLLRALAEVQGRGVEVVPLPFPVAPERRPPERLLASGVMTLEVRGARMLAESRPGEVLARLPAVIARAPIPAARVALMQALAGALRANFALPPPSPDQPGLLAQISARLASPLTTVVATALSELAPLTRLDPLALGLDLPQRYPGALAEARQRLAAGKAVPRWVVANTQGGDRSLVCASLMGRLPSADMNLLQALMDLAPIDFEPALHEMARESWVDPAAKAAAKACLTRMGR